jgi:thioredoxin-like negative regulator of GroEL
MRPMIENMFGPSRQAASPSLFQQQAPAPSQFPTPAGPPASSGVSSTATVPYMTDLNRLQSIIRNNTATVVYFTSATCPPCRVIAPIYDELVLSRGQQIMGVKVDVGMAQAIGRAFEIRSTPTFMFFLRGEKFSQFSGANQAELRSSIDLLVYSAHPGKSHPPPPPPSPFIR